MNTASKFYFPTSGKALDFVKICATIFMFIDHFNNIVLDGVSDIQLGLIGRGAFPLFCYATACALFRTPDDKQDALCGKYATRLLILALLVHPISWVIREQAYGNVLFTLAAGAALAGTLPHWPKIWQWAVFLFCASAVFFTPNPFEFGLIGALLPAAILMTMRGDLTGKIWLIPIIILMNAGGDNASVALFLKHWDVFFMVGMAAIAFSLIALFLARGLSSDGRLLSKYSLHVFYPGHMIFLGLLAYIVH